MKRVIPLILLYLVVPSVARAGGGPMNVMVLYNADVGEALAVAEHYQQARSLPVGHLCGVSGVDPAMRTMDFAEYEVAIHPALVDCLDALPHPEEIDYLVVVRGLPYRIALPDGAFYTSLSAMLQIHETARTSDGSLLAGLPQYQGANWQASIDNPEHVGGYCQLSDLEVQNDYYTSYMTACGIVGATEHPRSFRRADAGQADGFDFADNLFIVTRLDGFDYQDATDLVDRAVAADGTFPTAEILCMHAADSARGARDPECEFAVRHLEMAGLAGTWVDAFDSTLTGHEVAAYFTGAASMRDAIAGNTYAPGAIACNLTSHGAAPTNFFCSADGTTCPASESQTSIARFVRAGASGAHGTVAEPLNNSFPGAGTLLHYTFGYNLGESFFFNQAFLYWQNLYLGDPLTTPYAQRPEVTIASNGELPSGEELSVQAAHPDGVAAVRLYFDGALVAEATAGQLDWVVPLAVGTSGTLLAVAVAANAEVTRSGWPVETHLPQPDVQGWTTMEVTVVEAPVAPDAAVTDDGHVASDAGVAGDAGITEDDGGGGCDCRSGGEGTVPPLALLILGGLGLGLVRRRRLG